MRRTRPQASLLDEAERDIGTDDTYSDEELRADDEVTRRAQEAEALLGPAEPEPESLTPEELESLLEPETPAPETSLHEVVPPGGRPAS